MGGTATNTDTVGELVANDIATSDWSHTYRADVLAVVANLPDDFANQPAATVTAPDAANLYRRLAADGWTPHRLRRLHEILAAAFTAAAEEGAFVHNPFRNVRKPAAPKRELVIPTDDEVIALLLAPEHLVERVALRLAALLGPRRGEVVALQWRDIDLERETLVIRRSLSYTKASGITVGNTKTGDTGHRVLELDPVTVAMLGELHDLQLAQCRAKPGEPATPMWVISDGGGQTSWRPDRLTHVFAAARTKAGVTGVRLHDCRHYVATSMLHDGVPPQLVASQLGHSDMSTTIKVYSHYLPGLNREATRRRAARLDKKR